MTSLRIARCKECLGDLPAPATTGRPRDYCTERCKRRAKRRRTQVTPWPPAPLAGAHPIDPATLNRRTADAIVRALEGDTPAPPIDQLGQALLEAGAIAYRLEALERDLPANLAGPAGELGHRIRRDRGSLFPTLHEATR